MKIKVIMTDKARTRETMDEREAMLSAALSVGVAISVDTIKAGPDELDTCTDEAFAAAEVVRQCIRAERDGFDAAVIYCFSDVGVDAARENISIPVIGPGETALAVAGTQFSRFAVMTTSPENIPRTHRRLIKNPVAREKMTSVRAIETGSLAIADFFRNADLVREQLLRVCERAVREEGIDGVVLGCLGMARHSAFVEQALPIRVLDPAFLAVAYAEMCARLGIRHSESGYPKFQNKSNLDLNSL